MKTWTGSRQTREARDIATAADDAEREHRSGCIECIRAVRQRRDDQRCRTGRELAKARREADADLREQRKLDKQPMPGQDALFSADEVAAAGRQELTP